MSCEVRVNNHRHIFQPLWFSRFSSSTRLRLKNEELSTLLGITKNKLLAAILDESREEMEEMIGYLHSLKIPLSNPYSRLHSDLRAVIIKAAETEKENIDRENSIVTIPRCSKPDKQVPTYFSQFLEK